MPGMTKDQKTLALGAAAWLFGELPSDGALLQRTEPTRSCRGAAPLDARECLGEDRPVPPRPVDERSGRSFSRRRGSPPLW